MKSLHDPLSARNIVSGIIITMVGGLIVAYVLQEGRFAPSQDTSSDISGRTKHEVQQPDSAKGSRDKTTQGIRESWTAGEEDTDCPPPASHTGCISGNCENGNGTSYHANGGRYKGYFKQGKKHGRGTYCWEGGDKYVGEFANDKMHGYGIYYFSSGSRYEGYYYNNNKQGQGTYWWESGHKYVGQFANNEANGYGVLYFSNGARYEGYFHDDKKHGQGTYYYENGTIRTGIWQDGEFVN